MKNQTLRALLCFAGLLLFASLSIACNTAVSTLNALGDQTEEANKLINESNEMRVKADNFLTQSDAKSDEIADKDLKRDRVTIEKLAREQTELYRQSAESFRGAAEKLEQAGGMKISEPFKRFCSLKAQVYRKNAEIMDTMRSQKQEIVSLLNGKDEQKALDEMDRLKAKMNSLSKEGEDLERQAAKIEQENPSVFKAEETQKK